MRGLCGGHWSYDLKQMENKWFDDYNIFEVIIPVSIEEDGVDLKGTGSIWQVLGDQGQRMSSNGRFREWPGGMRS